jgi:hypothetical protein
MREIGTQMSDSQQVQETAIAIRQYPLPKTYVRWAVAIAKWIDVTVPCLTSNEQSQEVTELVIGYLRREGVSDMVIAEALSRSVYKYPYIALMTTGLQMLVELHERGTGQLGHSGNAPDTPQTSMGSPSPPDPQKDILRVRTLDGDFVVAANAGNRRAMEKIAKTLLDLLDAYGRAKKGKERMDAVGEEILRNAPNIARVIRVVGPEPPVPGPDGRTPRRVGPNTYVLDERELETEAAEAESEAEREAD